jgi:hypothetical protein
MSDEIDYGSMNKRIVFTDNDHRHAQLINRLRYDGITQSDFFRLLVRAYIDGDSRILEFIDENKKQSIKRKSKSKKLREEGIKRMQELALEDKEMIDDIFDLIAEEHPDL